MKHEHYAILVNTDSRKSDIIDAILNGQPPTELIGLKDKRGTLFSGSVVERYMDKEERHGLKTLTADSRQSLKSMSSGERKKALLEFILSENHDFIILDNPFDNLDVETQASLEQRLRSISVRISLVMFASRKSDLLDFMDIRFRLEESRLIPLSAFEGVAKERMLSGQGPTESEFAAEEVTSGQESSDTELAAEQTPHGQEKVKQNTIDGDFFFGDIPKPPHPVSYDGDVLIQLNKVCVSYEDKPILKDINWTIRSGDFWELRGNNGSGKTTILSMITGENPKGYGQDLHIFGRKKGSGESVWDIKKRIGYFTPAMTDKFTGYHSVENMIISGLNDSIGLYVKPTEVQLRTAKQWLQLIRLWDKKDHLFHDLSEGLKRLVMCARAMVKHPPLLILDEPTAGLDDAGAELLVALVNKFAKESETTVIFVSHRREPGLAADEIYTLKMTAKGSLGEIITESGT